MIGWGPIFQVVATRQWEQKGLAMWTTALAYVLDFIGLITFAAVDWHLCG